ncbi:transposable element Tcb1 transposase [Trichonephila clavipes]|nr:transposable element Tcb1 transposase [Trichonephila clavipes]
MPDRTRNAFNCLSLSISNSLLSGTIPRSLPNTAYLAQMSRCFTPSLDRADVNRLFERVCDFKKSRINEMGSFLQYQTKPRMSIVKAKTPARGREIGSRVGRNQTTVMRICDRWMQEGTTDRRGRSHSPQCTTSREDRQIVRMAVTDRSVTKRTIAQHSESVTHHSLSARTFRRRLQQSGLSARRPLLGLPLTQNHRSLCH